MKTIQFQAVLFLFMIALFTSCNPSALEDPGNYWNSSTLIRQHLNGKVKTVTTDNGTMVSSFNQDGFMTQTVYTTSNGSSTTTYNYGKTGELTSVNFNSTMSTPAINYSTTYVYEHKGKYIVAFPFPEHLMMSGLIPNLSSSTMTGEYGNTITFTFKADKLTIITASTSFKDTPYATYSGSYPILLSHGGSFAKDITYASNGMFKTVTTVMGIQVT